MKKKYIEIAWHHPVPNVERFDADKFKIKTEDGCLKLIGEDGPVRIIPTHRVDLVQFGEEEVPETTRSVHRPVPDGPRIVTGPSLVGPDGEALPAKFQDQ